MPCKATAVSGLCGARTVRENAPIAHGRPGLAQVPDDRLADERMQRKLFSAPALGALEDDPIVGPVDVVEAQSPQFAGSNAVDRQQQQDGAVANRDRLVAADRIKHPRNSLPSRPDRQSLQLVPSRSLHRRAQAGLNPPALAAVIEPLAQCERSPAERSPAPTNAHGLEESI